MSGYKTHDLGIAVGWSKKGVINYFWVVSKQHKNITYPVNDQCSPVIQTNQSTDFFFYLGFLSRTFTNHRTAGEEGGHFSNSSLPLPLDSGSVKWSHPGHFLESQGKFFLAFPCTLYYIFLTSKIIDETLKSFLGRSILHYYQIRNI